MIIAGYSGIGKSTFAAKNPEKVVDFWCMPYKYYLDPDEYIGESSKADPGNIMQLDWPYNYVEAIKKINNNGKIILIPSDYLVLELLRVDNIPYTLVYPVRYAKETYRKRFIDRGNTERFINIFIGCWDYFLDELLYDPCEQHIVLEPHQFLSDVISI